MSKKNPILSNAEKYTQPVVRTSSPPGDKKMPYSFAMAKQRVARKLSNALSSAMSLEKEASPLVGRDILHNLHAIHFKFLADIFTSDFNSSRTSFFNCSISTSGAQIPSAAASSGMSAFNVINLRASSAFGCRPFSFAHFNSWRKG